MLALAAPVPAAHTAVSHPTAEPPRPDHGSHQLLRCNPHRKELITGSVANSSEEPGEPTRSRARAGSSVMNYCLHKERAGWESPRYSPPMQCPGSPRPKARISSPNLTAHVTISISLSLYSPCDGFTICISLSGQQKALREALVLSTGSLWGGEVKGCVLTRCREVLEETTSVNFISPQIMTNVAINGPVYTGERRLQTLPSPPDSLTACICCYLDAASQIRAHKPANLGKQMLRKISMSSLGSKASCRAGWSY